MMSLRNPQNINKQEVKLSKKDSIIEKVAIIFVLIVIVFFFLKIVVI